jgi:lipoate-protein ligase A
MPLQRLLLWTDDTPRPGPLNMGLDEALLSVTDIPILRVYRWDAPWVSIGCFIPCAEAADAFPQRPLVRRWTGGGIVDHASDWTYSLIVPASESLAGMGTAESYRVIHQALVQSFEACGVPARLADAPPPGHGGHCFRAPVQADVIDATSRKIAGGAQRRTRHGLLHQGSVQGVSLPASLAQAFAAALHPHPSHGAPSALVSAGPLAESLSRIKYSSPDWLKRR